jgi:hypothetical protein
MTTIAFVLAPHPAGGPQSGPRSFAEPAQAGALLRWRKTPLSRLSSSILRFESYQAVAPIACIRRFSSSDRFGQPRFERGIGSNLGGVSGASYPCILLSREFEFPAWPNNSLLGRVGNLPGFAWNRWAFPDGFSRIGRKIKDSLLFSLRQATRPQTGATGSSAGRRFFCSVANAPTPLLGASANGSRDREGSFEAGHEEPVHMRGFKESAH